jgi:arabinan endo-1,5-alpha-L-arabinosidase
MCESGSGSCSQASSLRPQKRLAATSAVQLQLLLLLLLLWQTSSSSSLCSPRSSASSISGAPYTLQALDATALCPVHDPALAEEGGILYLFSTDAGGLAEPPLLRMRLSSDGGASWATGPAIFAALPAWAQQAVPAATNIWAPDVAFFGGLWHVYYAVSSFGSSQSVIGMATSSSLAQPSWADAGLVLASNASSGFNAIDPSLFQDPAGSLWLLLGSFWSGIKLLRLDASGKVAAGARLLALAQRPAPDAEEGSCMVARPGGSTFLFLSWNFCCRGAASTYEVRVGRSLSGPEGPFLDRAGQPLLQGGGSLLLGGGHGWAAGGGQSFLRTQSQGNSSSSSSVMVLHAYDAASGDPWVQLVRVEWGADGWPSVI